MMTDLTLILLGLCGGTLFCNIVVMLLVVHRLSHQPRRVQAVKCAKDDFGHTVEAWTAGPWRYVESHEVVGGVEVWFQEK